MGCSRTLQENSSTSPSSVSYKFVFLFFFFLNYCFVFLSNLCSFIIRVLGFWGFRNKTICVDLSCWMVQFQSVSKSHSCLKEKVYLQGLFHRLRALIALNCSIIFVSGMLLFFFCWFVVMGRLKLEGLDFMHIRCLIVVKRSPGFSQNWRELWLCHGREWDMTPSSFHLFKVMCRS